MSIAGDEPYGGAELVVLDDEHAVGADAARRTILALGEAIAARKVAHVALTGGSTAVPLYRELASPVYRNELDWGRVHLWWGDERFVPIDHPESNAGLAYRLLLAISARSAESGMGAQGDDVTAGDVPGLPIDPQNVHPIEVEETLSDSEPVELAASMYASDLTERLPLARHATPRFDVILTGIGPDGHIMSIFPGSPALAPDAPVAVAVPAPDHVEPHLPRVTLAARVLPVAELVLVMAAGDSKTEILEKIMGPERDPNRWPAQTALLPNAVWLLDHEAASRLP